MKRRCMARAAAILCSTVLCLSTLYAVPVQAQESDRTDDAAIQLAAEGAVDKSALSAIITEAGKVETDGYSEESIAAFEAAIAAAKAVNEKDEAEQWEVDSEITMLNDAARALIQKADADTVYDGTYTLDGVLHHASSDQNSMGNAALVKPMQLIVENGEATLRMEFQPMTAALGKTQFTGYLAQLNYFPDWEGGKTGYQSPSKETPVPTTVESWYEGVYDSYNDPKTGTDESIKGKLYPHFMTMPIELGDGEVWVQVYVPVMEAIMAGGGQQFAKLWPDWSTLTQLSGIDTDKTSLDSTITEARKLRDGLKKGDPGYSKENLAALDKSIANAEAVSQNMNVDQSAVDVMTEALQSAAALFDGQTQQADKSELEKAIVVADSYLDDETTGFTADTMKALQKARENAAKVNEDEAATQLQVNAAVTAVDEAIQNLKTEAAKEDTDEPTDSDASDTLDDGSSESGQSDAALDAKNLADGVYKVTGNMVKVNKADPSMSDKAINHTIKLTVKDGKYSITMDFNGLTVGNQLGYLGELHYFLSGYSINKYGAPQGSIGDVTIDTVQMNADGSKVSDTYGTDYPDRVTFELIPEALDDGYVPLQVFVPIMEAISSGTGTQPVYLTLDWDTLKQTTEDDPEFSDGQSGTTPAPALDLTDSSTGIRITAGEGVLPDGVTLVVRQITEGTEYDAAKTNSFLAGNRFVLYDIHFEDASGKEVEPEGRVTVSIPIPSGWDTKTLSAYHFNDNGSASPVIGSAADGMYTFGTNSFSKYALTERKAGGLNGDLTPGGNSGTNGGNSSLSGGTSGLNGNTSSLTGSGSTLSSGSPSSISGLSSNNSTNGPTSLNSVKTGDETSMGGWIAMILIAAGVLVLLFVERRRAGAR